MGKIKLNNIRTFSYHGCLTEEAMIGSEYRVDLKIKSNLKKASKTDFLDDTIDYVLLNHIVKKEMGVRSNLLEHVGKRIIDAILNECININKIKISISKINPPINGDVESVEVVMTYNKKTSNDLEVLEASSGFEPE